MMTWGRYYWPIFLATVFCALFGPEAYALATNFRNTLSEWLWTLSHTAKHLPIADWGAARYLLAGAYMIVFSWLFFHFFFHDFA